MPLFYKDIQVTEQRCIGFKCDRCKAQHEADDYVEMQEMMHWRNTGGYGSVWGDGTTVEITLRQKCTLELFGEFATVHDADTPEAGNQPSKG